MKLLYCLECLDMVALRREIRQCSCRLSLGYYARDEITGHVAGPCVCLGIDSAVLERGLRDSRLRGQEIRAFLIGSESDRVIRHGIREIHEAWYGEAVRRRA